MNTILVGTDYFGQSIQTGDHVVTNDGVQGEIETIWDDGTVDIHHANSHQGPVIDTYDIVEKEIIKTKYWE